MRIRSVPAVYNDGQLQEYLARIKWTGDAPSADMASLKRLMRHHLTTIPFGNAFIAYEDEPAGIDPQELFENVVRRKGGFFCFGQNLLFREMLRLIGFRCYSTAARVNALHASSDGLELGALSHMCLFVSFEDDPSKPDEDQLWLVDVGFGGPNLNEPIPIHQGATVKAALGDWHRISMLPHPKSALESAPSTAQGCKLPAGQAFALEYQTRDTSGKPLFDWRVCYAFSLEEMHTGDYEMLHYAICHKPKMLFTQNLLMSLHRPPQKDGEPMTRVTLYNDRMQEHRLGQDPIKTVFTSEAERIKALKEVFGLGNLRDDAEAVTKRKGLSFS